jgi:hypothetical protein
MLPSNHSDTRPGATALHGGRRQISQSGIKLAVITVPTKKEPKAKGAGGGGGDGAGAADEGGVDAGISLDAPQGGEDDKYSEAQSRASDDEVGLYRVKCS